MYPNAYAAVDIGETDVYLSISLSYLFQVQITPWQPETIENTMKALNASDYESSPVMKSLYLICRIRKYVNYVICPCPENGRYLSARPTCMEIDSLSFLLILNRYTVQLTHWLGRLSRKQQSYTGKPVSG